MYGKLEIPALNEDPLISSYLTIVAAVNESTAQKYNERLKKFGLFGSEQYSLDIHNIVTKIKTRKMDPFDVLSKYVLYLKQKSNNSISPNSLKIIL